MFVGGAQDVPAETIVVIITGEQDTAGLREGHGGDATDDIITAQFGHLGTSTNIEETTSGVVGAGAEAFAVGEQGDGIDVRFVATEGHGAFSCSDIPYFRHTITRTGDEDIGIDTGEDGQGHHISFVVGESCLRLSQFDVPQHTRLIS